MVCKIIIRPYPLPLINLACSVTFCSIYRLVIFFELPVVDITCMLFGPVANAPRPNEKIGTSKDSAIWTVVEPNLSVVSACLPTLRPLYRLFNWRERLRSRRETPKQITNSSSNFSRLSETIEAKYDLEIGGSTTVTDIRKGLSKAQTNGIIPLDVDVIYVTEEVCWSSSPASPH